VFGLSAVHFADDGASDDVTRGELLGFVALIKRSRLMLRRMPPSPRKAEGARRALYSEPWDELQNSMSEKRAPAS
jgi:hypothetical protein